MTFYNENGVGFDQRTEELLRELHGVKDVMVQNMEKLLERDFKIEVCMAKAQEI